MPAVPRDEWPFELIRISAPRPNYKFGVDDALMPWELLDSTLRPRVSSSRS